MALPVFIYLDTLGATTNSLPPHGQPRQSGFLWPGYHEPKLQTISSSLSPSALLRSPGIAKVSNFYFSRRRRRHLDSLFPLLFASLSIQLIVSIRSLPRKETARGGREGRHVFRMRWAEFPSASSTFFPRSDT